MIEETDGEIDNPENYNSFADIETFLTNKHEKLVMDVRDEGDNIVGFLSQIGWTNNEHSSPSKIIDFEEIFVLIDTNGGNSLIPKSLLHSKVQHREKVLNKILVYLG